MGSPWLEARRIGPVRVARIERALARSAASRSARVLTEAADAILMNCGAGAGGTVAAAAVAETLMQRAALQDLLVSEASIAIDLGDRLGALAIGLVDPSSLLCEIRTSAPRLRICPRSARWLTAVSLELIEGLAADLAYNRGVVTLRAEIRQGSVTLSAMAEPVEGGGPSLRLDGASTIAVAMGGRLRERLQPRRRSAVVTLSSLFLGAES